MLALIQRLHRAHLRSGSDTKDCRAAVSILKLRNVWQLYSWNSC